MKNKQKTHKGALKRFKITKTGKVLHRAHGARHLKSNKSKKQLRRLKSPVEVKGKIKSKILKLAAK